MKADVDAVADIISADARDAMAISDDDILWNVDDEWW